MYNINKQKYFRVSTKYYEASFKLYEPLLSDNKFVDSMLEYAENLVENYGFLTAGIRLSSDLCNNNYMNSDDDRVISMFEDVKDRIISLYIRALLRALR